MHIAKLLILKLEVAVMTKQYIITLFVTVLLSIWSCCIILAKNKQILTGILHLSAPIQHHKLVKVMKPASTMNFIQSSGDTRASKPTTKTIKVCSLTHDEAEFVKDGAIKLEDQLSSSITKSNNISYNLGEIKYAYGLEAAIKAMPVLDQGNTEACATFSTTEAVDILTYNKHKGTPIGIDYYSIHYSLEIGHAISSDTDYETKPISKALISDSLTVDSFPNPWDGTFPDIVLAQYESWGMVPRNYRTDSSSDDQSGFFDGMEIYVSIIPKLELVHDTSKLEFDLERPKINFKTLYNNLVKSNGIKTDDNHTLIKNALDSGKLVVIGIPVWPNDWNMGMTSWIYPVSEDPDTTSENYSLHPIGCSPPKFQDVWYKSGLGTAGGHAVLVIGYLESDEVPYYAGDGYFVIRNSWGAKNGSNGNNFISYYFADYLSWVAYSVSNATPTENQAL
jgi:C1A family cysteine protease